MKRYLILGDPADVHAHYVSWALEAAGYHTTFVNCAHDNCPTQTTLYLDDVADGFSSADWNGIEAAWCRRLPSPPAFDQTLGENEGYRVMEERRFTKWLIDMQVEMEDGAIRWINRPAASITSENKFAQLKMARLHGIDVPRTLVTAQPDRFRAFLKAEGTVVAKPLCPYSWQYDSGITLTTFVNTIDAENGSKLADEDIAQCLTMYQQRIDKVADIRMLIMGEDVFAYKIIQDGEQHLDFRIGFFGDHLKYEPITTPPALKKKIIDYMEVMRVNFASADFALTAEGRFVFLDLNPGGQWLFIETALPEARVGAKFCAFFAEGRIGPDVEERFPSLADYRKSDVVLAMEEAFQKHCAAQARPSNSWKENGHRSISGPVAAS
jgi:hypothetical protein